MTTNKIFNTPILNLVQVASWWLPEQMKKELEANDVMAVLPALQRGFVWKTNQIEYLWDSIVQGFPIGSLLLSEYTKNSKDITPKAKGSDGQLDKPTHFLLDGQQRATAIALGFRNIWGYGKSDNKPSEALWVDLQQVTNDERCFAFRVVTKAHPWGYSRKNPKSRTSSSMAKEALNAFNMLKENNQKRVAPHVLNIAEVFPWDAKAPVPVPLLIEAIRESTKNDVAEHLLQLLDELTIWNNVAKLPPESEAHKKFQRVKYILESNDNDFNQLVTGLKNSLQDMEIPAPVINLPKNISNKDDQTADEYDPIFNLFKRINTGGTTLSREDINYSMLKSAWPEARKTIEETLLNDIQLAQPARMVSLMSRLVLMINDKSKNNGLQSELSIMQFRSNLQKGLGKKLEEFCVNEGKNILDETWQLLTVGDYALPKVLAAQISQQAGDLMLLVMYWIYLMNKSGENIASCKKNKILGFIISIAWFSSDQKRCVNHLAQDLTKLDEFLLPTFFDNVRFSSIMKPGERGRIFMIPLPSPDELKSAIKTPILEDSDFIKDPAIDDIREAEIWNKREIWDHYSAENTPSNMENLFSKYADSKEEARIRWWSFFHRIYSDRRFLLYSQRKYVCKWFDWFDPTQPDQITDHNRPWDYDHILPYSWSHDGRGVYSELPNLVRIWVNANGNFRVWPLELNRSKGDSELIESKATEYHLTDKHDVYKASFIRDIKNWEKLEQSNKDTFGNNGNHWKIFVEASMDRMIDIYSEWYMKLAIDELMDDV